MPFSHFATVHSADSFSQQTINSLTALHSHLPDSLASALPTTATRTAFSDSSDLPATASLLSHGRSLWDDIYGRHSEKLLNKLALAHPDMSGYILAHHYGALLNSPLKQEDSVGRQLTSLVAVACLRAQGGVGAQLSSHIYGLRSADPAWRNVDESSQAAEKGQAWLSTNEGAEWVLRQVDRLVEVFGKEGGSTFGRVKSKL